MNRRSFLSLLSSLPLIGSLFARKSDDLMDEPKVDGDLTMMSRSMKDIKTFEHYCIVYDNTFQNVQLYCDGVSLKS